MSEARILYCIPNYSIEIQRVGAAFLTMQRSICDVAGILAHESDFAELIKLIFVFSRKTPFVFDPLLSQTRALVREITEQICCFRDVFVRFHSRYVQSAANSEKADYDRSGFLVDIMLLLRHFTPVGRRSRQFATASVPKSRPTFQSVLMVGIGFILLAIKSSNEIE